MYILSPEYRKLRKRFKNIDWSECFDESTSELRKKGKAIIRKYNITLPISNKKAEWLFNNMNPEDVFPFCRYMGLVNKLNEWFYWKAYDVAHFVFHKETEIVRKQHLKKLKEETNEYKKKSNSKGSTMLH
jgi:hypothetical protein